MVAKQHVAVLMGGFSSERSVSLSSGAECAHALETLGYRVHQIDVGRDVAGVLSHLQPDVVFNALHGPFGEDGKIQGVLEFLQIPYTHSGVMASALAMDKGRAKIIAEKSGVSVAHSRVMNRFDIGLDHPIEPPYVIKPVAEGSSFGVVIVRDDHSHPPQEIRGSDWKYGDEVLVEKYIAGRELTCAVLGDEVMDVCEIVPDGGFQFYDFQSKYQPGGSSHICPAKLSPIVYQNVQRMSLIAHQAIGCRGVSRSDFRFDEEKGVLVWLEINTQPGMTSTSLVPDIARNSGYSFEKLVQWMVEDASCMR
ncbi:D-alanine--D-alanine ligase [Bartonella tamiae]|uniref:D-alanine--D-alanine ligase n=1 Tax=Bartonella tamiae Th239 TaxID=1094558 RepID=J1JVR8_9HYPH|nr:D-alanine--D-alanine ligase [Bartonella tamiae]EJF89062.1 D-alanine-D-alanine ligase [Bartonella tamiae Th239]EJF94688.1 D-alanine-D-alanine ligase [Bartonella tamiae Th307]